MQKVRIRVGANVAAAKLGGGYSIRCSATRRPFTDVLIQRIITNKYNSTSFEYYEDKLTSERFQVVQEFQEGLNIGSDDMDKYFVNV